MKRILVTQRVVVDTATGERRDTLDQRWWNFLGEVGVAGVPVPNHLASADRLLAFGAWDGLLLTGGNDLVVVGGDAPERDEVERLLLRGFAGPVIGACRGMQHLAVVLGADLHRVSGHVRVQHRISGELGDRHVNSYHSWGIREPVSGFRVTATAADGGIEAIAAVDRDWQGILWHPEREAPWDVADIAWFRERWGVTCER